jgi:ketosteroid isomerase-like protein
MKYFGKIILLLCFFSLNVGAESMMSIERANKLIVIEFFEKYGKDPSFMNIVHPDVKWWVPETLPFGKEFQSRHEYFQMLGKNFIGFAKPMSLVIKSMIAEGNKVAVEVESNAEHKCGETESFRYNNKYHFMITLEDSKFVQVKEYNDTKHLLDLYNLIQSDACQIILNNS